MLPVANDELAGAAAPRGFLGGRISRETYRRLAVLAGRIAVAVAGIGAWQLSVKFGLISTFFVSSPADVAHRLESWTTSGVLLNSLGVTLREVMLGYLLGVVGGVFLGFILYELRILSLVFMPYIATLNAVPRVILAPLFILWFGLGIESKIAIVSLGTIVIIFYNTYGGLAAVDDKQLASMRIMHASRLDIWRYLMLPSALSWIFGGLRVSIGLAFGGAIVAEYLGSTSGLGYLIATAQGTFDTAGVFSGFVVVTATVLAILGVVGVLEQRLTRWKA